MADVVMTKVRGGALSWEKQGAPAGLDSFPHPHLSPDDLPLPDEGRVIVLVGGEERLDVVLVEQSQEVEMVLSHPLTPCQCGVRGNEIELHPHFDPQQSEDIRRFVWM